jgi:hypothetical protein
LNQISGQIQVTDTLSLAGQYFFEWEAYRYPEGGTYLGPVDFAFNGPNGATAGIVPIGGGRTLALGASNGGEVAPSQHGEFGLNARWSPDALDGTLGFYYRRYADKLPQALVSQLTVGGGALGANPVYAASQYKLYYGDDIDLFGVSFAKNIAGVSVGSELSYRHNTPLLSKILGIPSPVLAQAGVFTAGRTGTAVSVGEGDTLGPRGDTMHGLVNAVGIINKTPLFDAATWAAELVWSHWNSVSSGAETFNAEGYGGCTFNKNKGTANTPGNKWDGCATKNYFGLGASLNPTWYQVFPGVDLSLPITYSVGLKGNAATVFGGNQGNGNYSIGLGFDIFQKHRVDLKYISYFGQINDYGTNALGQQLITQNGFTTLLKDRDFISLTLKTTF